MSRVLLGILLLNAFLGGATPVRAQSKAIGCPSEAIAIEAGASIQPIVERAGEGAVFCLKNGIHRGQAVRPKAGQRFYGQGRTTLNGSRLVTDFRAEGSYWTTAYRFSPRPKHGECSPDTPTCNEPHAVFIDDRPLVRVTDKSELAHGKFFIDWPGGRIYLVDDPTGRKVEATSAVFAFQSTAPGVLISNLVVEKFAPSAQQGAIHAREAARWTIENSEIRLNSGAGISVGSGARVRDCDIHHNGQIGIEGDGEDIWVEDSRIWSNNIYGFDPAWEAGGVKLAETNGALLRGNHVHDNDGAGLWCDIECHNIVYADNLVEDNRHIGIFHEISFKAVIRDNVVRHNASANRKWFWGADIVIAASQDVEIRHNTLTVSAGSCGIVLIDQGRRADNGKEYKTRDNLVRGNVTTFEGDACAGGASDTKAQDENFRIIATGGNRFDQNTYRVARESRRARFVWGNEVTDWNGFRRLGQERDGKLVEY